jgi:S-adenosylmethionine:tRNA ribosyltransferase-isomerase
VKTADFDYSLPSEFIAQQPAEPRDASRLMVLTACGTIEHSSFAEIGHHLRLGDLLILNDTRVIPARLFARKSRTGGKAEVLLLKRVAPATWEALIGGTGMVVGTVLELRASPGVRVTIRAVLDGARRLIEFSEPIQPLLDQVGHVPLPPYIQEYSGDGERYQTVYARHPGSAAAPTAGLHFTLELLSRLRDMGMETAYVTLHVGVDTFAPVTQHEASEHAMHGEWCELSPQVAERINAAKAAGRRVVAVGTTTVRTLESAPPGPIDGQSVAPMAGPTHLFIIPGHRFRVVDAMITNFHLPRSTLLMLVSAFAGRERILSAYEEAKRAGYRFYSFGDAMLVDRPEDCMR